MGWTSIGTLLTAETMSIRGYDLRPFDEYGSESL
jgi:hypothetical protein